MIIRQVNINVDSLYRCYFGIYEWGAMRDRNGTSHGYYPENKDNTNGYYQTFILEIIQ